MGWKEGAGKERSCQIGDRHTAPLRRGRRLRSRVLQGSPSQWRIHGPRLKISLCKFLGGMGMHDTRKGKTRMELGGLKRVLFTSSKVVPASQSDTIYSMTTR